MAFDVALSKQEFRDICSRYAFEPAWYSRYRQVALEVLKKNPQSALFLGCGRGMIERMLPEQIACVSVDIEEEHLEIARAVNRGRAGRDIRFLSLFDINQHFPAGSFDAVVISEVIEHVEDDIRAVQIAFDMLRPGGYFFLSVPNIDRLSNRVSRLLRRSISWDPTHYREYTLEQIKKLVTDAGFEIEDAQGVYLLLPPEPLSRKIIPVDSSIRNAVKFFPSLGRNIFLICHKPVDQVTMQAPL